MTEANHKDYKYIFTDEKLSRGYIRTLFPWGPQVMHFLAAIHVGQPKSIFITTNVKVEPRCLSDDWRSQIYQLFSVTQDRIDNCVTSLICSSLSLRKYFSVALAQMDADYKPLSSCYKSKVFNANLIFIRFALKTTQSTPVHLTKTIFHFCTCVKQIAIFNLSFIIISSNYGFTLLYL